MLHIVFAALLFLLQSFLILTTKINVYPEIYFLSWLVHKGLIPYRDFFDHHGFLLSYILSFLSGSPSFFIYLKIIYFIVQSGSLIIFLIILYKMTSKIGFMYGGILYVLLNFLTSENNFWYENIITFLLLLTYLILIQTKYKNLAYLSGGIIAFASFIKPTAAIFIVPVLVFSRKIGSLVSFIFLWIMTAIYFFLIHGFSQFINDTFTFNLFLSKHYNDTYIVYPKLVDGIIIFLIATLFIILFHRKLRLVLLNTLFLIFSFIFLSTGYSGVHFLPFVTFFVLLISQVSKLRPSLLKYLYIFSIFIFILFIGQKTYYQYVNVYKKRVPWQENQNIHNLITELKTIRSGKENIYLLDNHGEVYINLNQLPPTSNPIKFPIIEKYDTNFEKNLIQELNSYNVKFIAIPKPEDLDFSKLTLLNNFATTSFKLIKKTNEYEIYKRD